MKGLAQKRAISLRFGTYFEMSACGVLAYSRPFPHSFAGISRVAGCHGVAQGDTPKAQRNPAGLGWPRAGWGRRGGGLQRRHSHLRHTPRQSDGASAGFRIESILGTGGAATLHRERGDCQVPSRRLCLSLRDSAAGPEWRCAPRVCTLALEQRLEQLIACKFSPIIRFRRWEAERAHSTTRRHSGIHETPSRFGAVSFGFGGRAESTQFRSPAGVGW